ncbi:hypothetical protein LCGC14_0518120 [marine sediment metagenome]|uniref:Uncharacterized protein n=1 Tax=marine sediment metagenome TaxID=412755 RepID=A0A0F9UKX6_9ZZZZ
MAMKIDPQIISLLHVLLIQMQMIIDLLFSEGKKVFKKE